MKDPTTGGEKGIKDARYELIPTGPLKEIARVFGYGSSKYSDRNWEKGYPYSWSYGALQRHLNAFWGGEDIDPESGHPHLSHAGFHILALLEFSRTHPEKDDRSKDVPPPQQIPSSDSSELRFWASASKHPYTSSERGLIDSRYGNRDYDTCKSGEPSRGPVLDGSKLG